MTDRSIKPGMRALTLWQPYAWAIPRFKSVENRPWEPPEWLLGQHFAIHAGTKRSFQYESAVCGAWDRAVTELPEDFNLDALPRGAVTAVARLIGWCRLTEDGVAGGAMCYLPGDDASAMVKRLIVDSPHSFGPVCWLLDSRVELLEPVPCRGYQKLWTLPPDVEAEVRRQLAEIRRRL